MRKTSLIHQGQRPAEIYSHTANLPLPMHRPMSTVGKVGVGLTLVGAALWWWDAITSR
jgi:hypothetical protein